MWASATCTVNANRTGYYVHIYTYYRRVQKLAYNESIPQLHCKESSAWEHFGQKLEHHKKTPQNLPSQKIFN